MEPTNDDRTFMDEMDLPQPDAEDLRGRQSVRATFKLTLRAIEALNIAAVHLGIKQKSLFDHLIEDVQTLNRLAQEIEGAEFRVLTRIQKTFVISRRSLKYLDEISRESRTPRDALVEYSIQRLLPVITREREKHRRRKEILAAVRQHFEEGRMILARARSELGPEDPLTSRLEEAIDFDRSVQESLERFVRKGSIIESF